MAGLENINPEFFKPYLTVLKYFRCTAIDIFDEKNVLLFKFKYAPVLIFLCFMIATYSHWRYVIHAVHNGMDLIEFAVELSFCFNVIECSLIYLHLFLIKERINNYVMKLQKLWRNDDSLLPKGILLKRDQVKQIDLYVLNFCKLIEVFLYFYFGTPLLMMLIQKIKMRQDVAYVAPVRFMLPFDYQNNIALFVLVYIIDYSIKWKSIYVIYGSLFFLSVTMNQLRTLFLLIQEDFKTIIIKTRDTDIDVKLKRTIQKHYKLLDMLLQLGDAYGGIFGIHVFFLCITICFYGIAARINSRLEDVKNFMICVISSVNIYYCCKHGQLATDSALDVAAVIYDSPWEDLSSSNRMLILMIILRSQRATYIRSTSFTEISLKTFKMIMNATWSFISLIAKLYEK